eukprot:TRINITY_DN7387_c0_g1_i1.p1 TRINITY_DN7387_c0_g1~~TRINITY_DN7387_c0_g1_i1.p1  ORF type:complete len:170 (+),score=15.97 TRINITY_DN7387_c0_g1_i1:50-559(+)
MSLSNGNWTSPFRWHWKQDSKKFEPYNDVINQLLEANFDQYKHHNGPSRFTTPPLTRYVDDTPCPYHIDFQTMTQYNAKTNYARSIRREAVAIIQPNASWEYLDSAVWMSFDPMVQGSMESAYQNYVKSRGPSNCVIRVPGRVDQYEVDFVKGTQKNLSSATTRLIRRK